MKRYLKLLFAASIITLFNACETDVYDPEKIENTKDLVVPADFDWKTTQSLTYSITSKVNTVISVYTDRNCTDESLLIENFALKANEATEIPVSIPAYVTKHLRAISHDRRTGRTGNQDKRSCHTRQQ